MKTVGVEITTVPSELKDDLAEVDFFLEHAVDKVVLGHLSWLNKMEPSFDGFRESLAPGGEREEIELLYDGVLELREDLRKASKFRSQMKGSYYRVWEVINSVIEQGWDQ